MLRVQKIIGNINDIDISELVPDFLDLEWYEVSKTIIRKHTRNGLEIGIKKDLTPLEEGDIIFLSSEAAVMVSILPTSCIVFKPNSIKEMAIICYEIGNQHIPIYINREMEVIVAFEHPLYQLMDRFGFDPKKEDRKILKTSRLGNIKHGTKSMKAIKFKDAFESIPYSYKENN